VDDGPVGAEPGVAAVNAPDPVATDEPDGAGLSSHCDTNQTNKHQQQTTNELWGKNRCQERSDTISIEFHWPLTQ
jgi:hypothetical protein